MSKDMDRAIQKLKDMGVTVSVNLAPGVPGGEDRPAGLIAQAAKDAGIYYDNKENK